MAHFQKSPRWLAKPIKQDAPLDKRLAHFGCHADWHDDDIAYMLSEIAEGIADYDRDQAKLALAKAIGERRTGRIAFQMQASGSEGRISADCDVKAARGKRTRVEVVPRPSAVACRFASQGRRLPAQLAFNGHGGKPAKGVTRVGEFKYRDLTIAIMEQQGTTGLPARNTAATYLFEIDGEPAGSVELAELPKVHMLEVRAKVSRKAMMMAASAMAVLSVPREAHRARLSE